jgi:hypothetical protein
MRDEIQIRVCPALALITAANILFMNEAVDKFHRDNIPAQTPTKDAPSSAAQLSALVGLL